jgi:putative two-component system response regulator
MENPRTGTAKILIIDDQPANVLLLEGILDEEDLTAHRGLTDPRDAISVFLDYQPDLVLLDLQMPYLDGFAVLEQLRALLPSDGFLPIVVLTANITPQARRQALAQGAADFLTKPFDPIEVVLRIRNLVRTRHLHLRLHDQNEWLEVRVRERTAELEAAQGEILERLALAAEYRDDDTGQHTQRVGQLAGQIAQAMGLPPAEVELIQRAAPLHDVGKIAVPDAVLLKPGKLTSAEFEQIKTHTLRGAEILGGGRFPLLQRAEEIALTHHERWDGTGYAGLAGDAIPLAGRIVAAADVYDALTHERPYKRAWSHVEAVEEIIRLSGRHFDPEVVKALLLVLEDLWPCWKDVYSLQAAPL